jgi:hypothetical protein
VTPFVRVCIALCVGASLCLLTTRRLSVRGQWLPEIPVRIGAWDVSDVPVDQETLLKLGNPRSLGREFVNPLDERVFAQIAATTTLDAYRMPKDFLTGYTVTAERYLPALGKDRYALAQILKQDGPNGLRVVMLSWVQDDHGTVRTDGTRSATTRSFWGRLSLGAQAAQRADQSVIFRVYALINPTDRRGEQARRNVSEIGRALYEGAKRGAEVRR